MLEVNLQIVPILLIFWISSSECFYQVFPEQVHLSFGEHPREMVVTWVTFADTKYSFVWYQKLPNGMILRAEGCAKKFVVEKYSKRVRYVHRVILTSLEPLSFYAYRCGSICGASGPHIFKTSSEGSDWPPRVIIFGDMGWKGSATFPYMLKEAEDFDVDAIIHVGDIGYDLPSYDGVIGDKFMRMIEPLASFVPYMTIPGNHEQQQNFSFYKNIFSMPGDSEGLYYSFNLGPIHFVAISSEVYYFTKYGVEPLINQFEWLKKDLIKANEFHSRLSRPWVIVLVHRPLYCSSDTNEECSQSRSFLRCCMYNNVNYGLEPLFLEQKVDLIFSGHMHYYERSWPIFQGRAYPGTCAYPYRNAKVPVQIITGAAGMKCGTESASYIRSDWFAFYSNEFSYSILTAYNKTHVHLEQVSAMRSGRVIDSAWFVKDGQPC